MCWLCDVLNYLSVPLQLLVELRWLYDGGLVPAVEPGVVRHPPNKGASPLLASATFAGSFSLPLRSFRRVFLDRSNSDAAELTFVARVPYAVERLSCDDEKYRWWLNEGVWCWLFDIPNLQLTKSTHERKREEDQSMQPINTLISFTEKALSRYRLEGSMNTFSTRLGSYGGRGGGLHGRGHIQPGPAAGVALADQPRAAGCDDAWNQNENAR